MPNAVHTALLQEDWLASHMKVGTVTVLVGEEQIKAMNESEVRSKIAISKSPKFWKISQTDENKINSWTNSFKGHV